MCQSQQILVAVDLVCKAKDKIRFLAANADSKDQGLFWILDEIEDQLQAALDHLEPAGTNVT